MKLKRGTRMDQCSTHFPQFLDSVSLQLLSIFHLANPSKVPSTFQYVHSFCLRWLTREVDSGKSKGPNDFLHSKLGFISS
jgi:hypothetical protein